MKAKVNTRRKPGGTRRRTAPRPPPTVHRQPSTVNRQPSPVHRLQDWPGRLFALVEERRAVPFAWGTHDCCLFACDGIRALTGLDPAAESWRGRYSDAPGAARLVRQHGGVEAIAAKVCAAHGWPEVPPRLAQRGDVVLAEMPVATGAQSAVDGGQSTVHGGGRATLGVCVGGEAAFPGAAGLVFWPLKACRKAWRIG